MRTIRIIGTRSINAPEGWEVYNAPRPLYASSDPETGKRVEWIGDFRHGTLYAAIDPNDPDAEMWREENRRLDAVRIEWISEEEWREEVWDYGRKVAEKYNRDLEDFTFEEVERSYRMWLSDSEGEI